MNSIQAKQEIETIDHRQRSARRIDLSIVVVSYNTRELTCKCLSSIYESQPQISFEIIVYDNGSVDGSADAIKELFPGVHVICSDTNIGFGAANNIAVSTAKGDWVLLLNPDTQVLAEGVEQLFHFASTTSDQAIYGGASVTPEGEVDHRSCWGKPSLWGLTMRALGLSAIARHSSFFNPEEIPGWQRDSTRDVDVVTGCFLMLKKTEWEKLNGFDVDYFMYSEETDLCLRAARKGMRRIFYPNARVLHIGGASERSKAHKTIKLFRGKRLYFEKNYCKTGSILSSLILDLHVLARLTALRISLFQSTGRKQDVEHWQAVWRKRRDWNQPQIHMGRRLEFKLSETIDMHRECSIKDSLSKPV